ncbi:MAG TPA: hypothetical protein VHQ22_03525 [Terriglobales bacterium]|nr:hypothetical protein [Terriglobales bacterium]
MLLSVTVGVTGHATNVEPRLVEIDRLVNSHTLHGSESLCKLLRYLADHAIRKPGVALKEYQIATEVFGRPAEFDPQLDSLVRVQAGRLRSKIAEYYASEGAEDPMLVELPKGTYALSFHPATLSSKNLVRGMHEPDGDKDGSQPRRSSRLVLILSSLLVVSLAVIAWLAAGKVTSNRSPSADETAAPAFRVFWHAFANGPDAPWVIFSNGAFIGRPETGLRYFDPKRDSRDAISDHYTGVGEVLAVYDLNQVFAQLHRQVRVKRGSLFSLDDAQNNNLIFVGSPAENLSLRDIPSTHHFVFQRSPSGPRKGDLAIFNVDPRPDEPKMFFASPSGTPLTEDYAIVGLVPGMNSARSVLILAGTTTIGTQAAAEYVCRQDSLEQLLLRLSVSENGEMKPFEAVLHVKVARGVPVGSQLVALRELSP